MFDIAFSELVVIGIVALIIIGPEKLPKVARTVGLLLGRIQRYVNGVKSDISRELRFEELQRLQQEVQQSIHQAESTIRQTGHDVEHEMRQVASVVEAPEASAEEVPVKPEQPPQAEVLPSPVPQQAVLDLSQPEAAAQAPEDRRSTAELPIPSKQDKVD